MKTKVCTKCKKRKLTKFFSIDNATKDKLCCSCKACQLIHRKRIDTFGKIIMRKIKNKFANELKNGIQKLGILENNREIKID